MDAGCSQNLVTQPNYCHQPIYWCGVNSPSELAMGSNTTNMRSIRRNRNLFRLLLVLVIISLFMFCLFWRNSASITYFDHSTAFKIQFIKEHSVEAPYLIKDLIRLFNTQLGFNYESSELHFDWLPDLWPLVKLRPLGNVSSDHLANVQGHFIHTAVGPSDCVLLCHNKGATHAVIRSSQQKKQKFPIVNQNSKPSCFCAFQLQFLPLNLIPSANSAAKLEVFDVFQIDSLRVVADKRLVVPSCVDVRRHGFQSDFFEFSNVFECIKYCEKRKFSLALKVRMRRGIASCGCSNFVSVFQSSTQPDDCMNSSQDSKVGSTYLTDYATSMCTSNIEPSPSAGLRQEYRPKLLVLCNLNARETSLVSNLISSFVAPEVNGSRNVEMATNLTDFLSRLKTRKSFQHIFL